MRIAATSDIHYRYEFEIPYCDFFVVAGDMLGVGTIGQLGKFREFLRGQRHKYRHAVIVPGNHDAIFADSPDVCRTMMGEIGGTVLIDQPWKMEGVYFYGSPYTPEFGGWDFMLPRGEEIRRKWDLIPEGLDVLITHGPPHGILDETDGRWGKFGKPTNAGCEELRDKIQALTKPPKFHVFGHIHHSHGRHETEKTTYLNVALCDESYQATNPVQVFDVET